MDVLYVTDGSPSVESTVTTLERILSPVRIRSATFEDTLEDLVSEPVDCVVVDVTSPGEADLAFLHRIRNADPDVPVVLVSDVLTEEVVGTAIEADVTDCLPRGIANQDVLLARKVRQAVEKRHAERDLAERVKELTAIQRTAQLLEDVDQPIEDVLSEFVAYLPQSFRRPESTAVRATIGECIVASDGFGPGEQSILARGTTDDGTPITLEVATREGVHPDRPFLPEEETLVETLLSMLEFHLDRRQSRQRLDLALEAASAGIWEWDIETGAVVWDESLERLFGLEPGSFDGTYGAFLEFVHPEDREAVEGQIAEILERPGRFGFEFRIVRPDGTIHWLATRGTAVTDGDGEPVRLLGIEVDVTERKERNRQLQVVNHLLRHNVRNDMTVVRGYAEAIRDGDSDREQADVMIETIDELLETIDKKQTIVDVLSGPRERIPIDLVEAVREVTESVADRFPDAEIALSLPNSCEVLAVPELEMALEELLENAIVHNGGERPALEVAVERDGRTARVRVADDGPAIPEMEVDVLTGARSIDPLYHGSGLGLWVVHWVVKRSEGRLSFDANEPRGNVVTVDLPCTDS